MLWLIVVTLYLVMLGIPLLVVSILAIVGGYYRERDMRRAIREAKRARGAESARGDEVTPAK